MDWKQAWSTTTTTTNTALDALAPTCAPFAARWDREAERRTQLRTPENLKALMAAQREHNSARSTAAMARNQRSAARKASNNPLSGTRRAARTADKAARQHHSQARSVLKAARKNYPATLAARAVHAHAAHAVPGALASWLMSEATHTLTLWPASVSAGLIGLNVAALWLGRRQPSVRLDDGMSAEERRLASRLDPSFWVQNADARGLSGTVPTPAKLTPAGLVSHVRLDGRWTPKTFRAKADEIRALLGARTDLRMEITSGSHGDRATITLRTRSAADGIDLNGWTPGAPWGVDTVTGEPVMVPLGRRMLVAGTSGSGKSWSTRALLAEGSEAEDHRLVVIDPKRVEAMNWQHRARAAITPDEVLDVTDDLVAEMHERLALIPRGQDVIAISAERPRITVFVDEGAEVIAMAATPRARPTKEDPGDPDWGRIMDNLRTLARMARAAEIILIWATQKPTMDRNGGIDPQISAQITYRAALALSTSGESRVVFGEDATEKGWHAHELPMPGVAMLRFGPKAKPHPISTRAFSPADVIALPDRPTWHRGSSRPSRTSLRLVKESATPTAATASAPASVVAETNRDRVLRAVHDGARTLRDITDRTGINKGTVSREIKALTATGALRRTADGGLQPGHEAA
ncbi:DNA segregation ATPase FtsK/SpoIIIE, S-DNA-T family [Streptomyces sp. 136MFCol5.1]|uniref:MarR family transcriptional regulator n=1 Tax=Streptomyces sp. 136MFCol5.1 TaxID=1172182 RepID=UPI00088ADEB9|nr:helix-turn-helix domain-containing protein [Streptomyces sp. 136MFCol5.1]SCY77580.1 DNA segregation ATPase FtsK/SpoIIIE, S-DNA-T family [Streptomyces sp. 136MFCol5.1]